MLHLREPDEPDINHDSKHRLIKVMAIGLLAFFLMILLYKFFHTPTQTLSPGFPVVATTVENKNVTLYLSGLGNVIPTNTVMVKTQINGLLEKVFYKQGQMVKKGDRIAKIDERPFLAELTQYQGQRTRDEALLTNALVDLQRYQQLWKQNSIAEQVLVTQEALVKQYRGAIEFDTGLIERAKLNLMYCNITSPIDGRVGLRLVDPGNFVQTTDTTGLVIITALNPITIIFTIPEDDIPGVLPRILAHKDLRVEAYDRQQKKLLATGRLITIDNEIDPSTGMVKLRAEFSNKNNQLFANQFVNVKLSVESIHQAAIIATAAIQHGNKGDFVFLIHPNHTVSVQKVKVGATQEDFSVILEGLKKGQQVVLEGADKLTNGSLVRVL